MIHSAYRGLSKLLTPLGPVLLRRRLKSGREEAGRLDERLGHPSLPRPDGALIWLHAASVGEAQSVLRLIQRLRETRPGVSILITTGTVTSAAMLAERLPERVFHQYVPLDLPDAVHRFIAHWRPDAAIWIESELWPNLIREMSAQDKPMAIVNGRMSQRSFRRWKRFPSAIMPLLAPFDLILGQSAEAAERYRQLGAPHVRMEGNLKYAADPLPADTDAVAQLSESVARRPAWIAASIHPGEEAFVGEAHLTLQKSFPDLLTLVAPRHPARAVEMIASLSARGIGVARRSQGDTISDATDLYMADTMGELGLLYSQSAPVFVGGSLVRHGGQNMLEPARFGRALLTGPHTWNFSDVIDDMRQSEGLIEIENAEELAGAVGRLLRHPEEQRSLGVRAEAVANRQAGVLERVLARLAPLLPS